MRTMLPLLMAALMTTHIAAQNLTAPGAGAGTQFTKPQALVAKPGPAEDTEHLKLRSEAAQQARAAFFLSHAGKVLSTKQSEAVRNGWIEAARQAQRETEFSAQQAEWRAIAQVDEQWAKDRTAREAAREAESARLMQLEVLRLQEEANRLQQEQNEIAAAQLRLQILRMQRRP